MSKDQKPKRRNALGRGLSALLNDSGSDLLPPRQEDGPGSVSEIPIESIEANPWQPRTRFDQEALQELADSIRVQGIIQPITVRRMGDGTYQLISGERRLQASKIAGLESVPAYVRTANDEQMLEMALIENIQRQDLDPIEIALGYQRLVEELKLRLEDLGDKVGKKRATVNNYLRLLRLPPDIQIGLRDNDISMGHARALITVESPDAQLNLYERVVNEGLSVRKVEELVRNLDRAKPVKEGPKEKSRNEILIYKLEERLEEKFGNRVEIRQNPKGKGEMKIRFDSMEDLNRILEILEVG